MKLKQSWLPFILILGFWIIISFLLDPWDVEFIAMFYMAIIALAISYIYIGYKIVVNHKKNTSMIFITLSRLPFLIIASHALVLFSGRTFSSEGGWWILYALLMIGLPVSVILYITGKAIEKYKSR